MKKLNLVRWLVMAVFWVVCLPVFGQAFTVGNVMYEPRGSGDVAVKKITIPKGAEGDSLVIAIPEKVSFNSTQYTVSTIGTVAGTSVLVFPDTCKFQSVTVDIPGSVSTLYAKALNASSFGNGFRLRLNFRPNSNIKSWPEGMFSETCIRSLRLPKGVWTEIPENFCLNTTVDTVLIPDNCRSIGKKAFAHLRDRDYGCINRITLPYGLESIADSAFFQNDPITEYYKSYNTSLHMTLRIPSTVTTLGKSAFEGMRTLCTIIVPGSIKTIPERAFADWFGDGQMSLYLGEGIERIEADAFRDNGGKKWSPYGTLELGLEFVTIPSTVKFLGNNCFADFQRLRTIALAAPKTPQVTSEDISIMPKEQRKKVYFRVPKASLNHYQQYTSWSGFEKMVVFDDVDSQWVKLSQNLKDGGTVKGEGVYICGSTVTIEAAPAKGYRFAGWMHEGKLVSTQPKHTFYAHIYTPNYADQITYMAVFEPTAGRTTTKPDPIYRRTEFGVEDQAYYFDYQDMSLYRGAQLDPDWVVDGKLEFDGVYTRLCYPVNGKYVHAHPDKYADEVITNLKYCYDPSSRYSAGLLRAYFPEFPITEEHDAQGNALPGATLQVFVPIRNEKTGERDSVMFTTDIFLKNTADPVIVSGMDVVEERARAPRKTAGATTADSVLTAADTGTPMAELTARKNGKDGPARAIFMDDKFYDLMPTVVGLDRVNGFDFELVVTRSKYDKKKKCYVKETVDSVSKHYGPNELKLDDPVFDPEYNPDLPERWANLGLNSRYAEGTLHLQSNSMDRNYNYMFTVRARNYNANGKPRKWVWDMYGKPNKSVDLSKLEVVVCEDRFWNWKRKRVTEDVTNLSNKDDIDMFVYDLFDKRQNYAWLSSGRAERITTKMHLWVNSYPSSWGKCQILIENEADGRKVYCKDVKKTEHYELTFPRTALRTAATFTGPISN